MSWLLVVVGVSAAGVGGVAVWLLAPRLRSRRHAGTPPLDWPRPFPTWGLDIECGIDAVDGEGRVIGTVLVPAPPPN